MNHAKSSPWALWLSFPLAVLVAVASLGGLLLPSAYSAETQLCAAQTLGIDAGNLAAVLPILLIAAVLALRGSDEARLIWLGTLACLVYNFAGYAFGLHFNVMFLAYCGVLGLGFFALAGGLSALPVMEVARRYGPRAPARVAAAMLVLAALGTVFHWLAEVVPALLAVQVPQSIRDSRSLTEPVAVLDLAFMAPYCLLTAILLLRRKPLGFVLGPVLLTFLAHSGLGLVPMGIAMNLRGFKAGFALYAIALGIAAGSAVLLALSLRSAKAATP